MPICAMVEFQGQNLNHQRLSGLLVQIDLVGSGEKMTLMLMEGVCGMMVLVPVSGVLLEVLAPILGVEVILATMFM